MALDVVIIVKMEGSIEMTMDVAMVAAVEVAVKWLWILI
jgi:hypothetical protein